MTSDLDPALDLERGEEVVITGEADVADSALGLDFFPNVAYVDISGGGDVKNEGETGEDGPRPLIE